MIKLDVNGQTHEVNAPETAPLLFVLRNDLRLNGPKYGCGLAQCGACTVLVGGQPVRSCVTHVSSVVGQRVETIESLGDVDRPGPLQRAFLDEQAAQCGYCLNGIIMRAKALLDVNPSPSESEARAALDGNLCRCGAHNRMIRAVLRAANER